MHSYYSAMWGVAAALVFLAYASAEPVVTVPGLGELEGTTSKAHPSVALFHKIPYAKPPVGSLRWQPPEPHGPWESPRDATQYGPRCFQPDNEVPQSEDCLHLNVATPASALAATAGSMQTKRLPVMAWIHGGSYVYGSASEYFPDATVAASNLSVVVVTLNYRLNVFGFLASTALQRRSADGSVGNYGIQDQRLALAWIRDNIGAFGGSAHDVTIWGQSAGGNSVITHLVSPSSFPLYNKAIIESGTYRGATALKQFERWNWTTILNITRCRDVLCLVNLSAETLHLAQSVSGIRHWGPIIDGVALTDEPMDLVARGQFNNKVPVLLGSNRDERAFWTVKLPSFLPNMTESYLANSAFAEVFDMKTVMALYDPSRYTYPKDLGNYSLWWWMGLRIWTDGGSPDPGWTPKGAELGHCGARRFARRLLQGGSPAVYAYSFEHPTMKYINVPGTGPGAVTVAHGTEIPYVFGLTDVLSEEAGESSLAESMSSYWSAFARKGDPNLPTLPEWPSYDAGLDTILRLDTQPGGIELVHEFRNEACNYWDSWDANHTAVVPAAVIV